MKAVSDCNRLIWKRRATSAHSRSCFRRSCFRRRRPGQRCERDPRSDDGPSSVPQDRIVPFLGGGPLLRSSALLAGYGVVVALGGAPIELVVATDVSLQFLRVTDRVESGGPLFPLPRVRESELSASRSGRARGARARPATLAPRGRQVAHGRERAKARGGAPPPPATGNGAPVHRKQRPALRGRAVSLKRMCHGDACRLR